MTKQEVDMLLQDVEMAHTDEAIARVRLQLFACLKEHPEFTNPFGEIFTLLILREEGIKSNRDAAHTLNLSGSAIHERSRLQQQARSAETLSEVQEARSALLLWGDSHPADPQLPTLLRRLDNQEIVASLLMNENATGVLLVSAGTQTPLAESFT